MCLGFWPKIWHISYIHHVFFWLVPLPTVSRPFLGPCGAPFSTGLQLTAWSLDVGIGFPWVGAQQYDAMGDIQANDPFTVWIQLALLTRQSLGTGATRISRSQRGGWCYFGWLHVECKDFSEADNRCRVRMPSWFFSTSQHGWCAPLKILSTEMYSCKQQKWNPPQFSSKIIRYYYEAEFVSVDHVVELVKGLSRLSWIWRQCLRPSNSEQEQLASHERRLPVPCACKEFDKHASRCWGESVRLGCRQILFA